MEIVKNKRIVFNDDDFLWKYLDLHKFLSFILNKKLFFNRLDFLEDPLEGLPESTLSYMDKSENGAKETEELNAHEKRRIISENKKKASLANKGTEDSQQTQFANCWYMGKKESFAMWNIYSNPDSVAIRYKPQELLNLVLPSATVFENKDFTQFIYGYVDYDDLWPFQYNRSDSPNVKFASFRKDSSYKHEQEFRFVSVLNSKQKGKYDYFELKLDNIETESFMILANPYMEGWKFDNIFKFMDLFGCSRRVKQSVLKVKK